MRLVGEREGVSVVGNGVGAAEGDDVGAAGPLNSYSEQSKPVFWTLA